MATFQTLDLITLLPEIIILGAALILLLIGACKDDSYMPVIGKAAILAIAVALFMEITTSQNKAIIIHGMFISTGFTIFSKILVLIGALASILWKSKI